MIMNDRTVKPQVYQTLKDIYYELLRFGLSKDMIITLVQRKTRYPRGVIENTIEAFIDIEEEIRKNYQYMKGLQK
jgi:predicted translin family RNA/ssDNA-binding protein